MSSAPLGEFEVLVLMAVLHAGEHAYAPAVREAIEQRTGRDASRGAVYVTLDRLEQKRLLESRLLTDAEGGRPRRTYRATRRGVTAVRSSLRAFESMRRGIEPLLEKV